MFIACSNISKGRNSLLMDFSGGDMMRRVTEFELQQWYKPDNDPEKPPSKGPGDKYYAIGALIGAIIGIIAGLILSRFGGLIVIDVNGGAVVGSLIGTVVGSLIRKYVLNKESRKESISKTS